MIDTSDYPDLFYYARHGQTEGNLHNVVVGSSESPLTEKGKQQASAKADLVFSLDIALIAASPLDRARETAFRMNALKKCPTYLIPLFYEWNVGTLTGQIEDSSLHYLTTYTDDPPGGETRADFEARIHLAMVDYARLAAGRTGLIVAHAGAGRALRKNLGLDPAAPIPNCSIFCFRRRNQLWSAEMVGG